MPGMREAVGGWIAAPADYARFLLALDGQRGQPLLAPASFARLVERPPAAESRDKASWYGLGFFVATAGDRYTLSHSGGLPGTLTYAVRQAGGTLLVAFFNGRPRDAAGATRDVARTLNAAAREVATWPAHDLFD